MNKKGFTLIELLASITILGLITTAASINIVKIHDDKKSETKEIEESIITTAACTFIELEKNKNLKKECLSKGCEVNTNTLISEGLLNETDVSNKININIYKENNEKKCIIKK